MKSIYILCAWAEKGCIHPSVETFTNKRMAIKIAKVFKEHMNYYEVTLRHDYLTTIGWNKVGEFIQF